MRASSPMACRTVSAALAAAALAVPAGAAAAPPEPVEVRLAPRAVLGENATVTGRVQVTCPAGLGVTEAGVTLSQDDQTLFNQGFIDRITCTGRPQWYRYRVFSLEPPFHPGPARVSAFVFVEDASGTDTLSGGDTRVVKVVG